jgi:hypothetical protein
MNVNLVKSAPHPRTSDMDFHSSLASSYCSIMLVAAAVFGRRQDIVSLLCHPWPDYHLPSL